MFASSHASLLLLLLTLSIGVSNKQEPQQAANKLALGTQECSDGSPDLASPHSGASGFPSTPDVSQDEDPFVHMSANSHNSREERAARDIKISPNRTVHPDGRSLSNIAPRVGRRDKRSSSVTTEVSLINNDTNPRPQKKNVMEEDNLTNDDNHKGANEDNITSQDGVQFSPVHNTMLLCHHPPNKFSPHFLGHHKDSCDEIPSAQIVITKTLGICNDIYYIIYRRTAVYYWFYHENEPTFRLFFDENFNALCLPFFRRFNHCEEKKFVTLCRDEEVLFLHPHSCQQPSALDIFFQELLILSSVNEDDECFRLFCDGTLRIIESNVSGVTFRLVDLEYRLGKGKSCLYLFNVFSKFGQDNNSIYALANVQFACCYAHYIVLWASNPEDHGINPTWDYLPLSCRISEILLVVAMVCVAVCGTVGNTAILVVMLSGGHPRRETTILRTSLAFSDLFISLFIVIPSVTNRISVIAWGELNLYEDTWTDFLEQTGEIEFHSRTVVDSGFRMFQSLVLTTCSEVSLFTLFFLSIERFILTARRLVSYKAYCSIPRVIVLVILTWTMALVDAFSYTYDEEGTLNSVWSDMDMFTIGISRLRFGGFANGMLYFRLIFLSLTCILTFAFSTLATAKFMQKQAEVADEWKRYDMRVIGPTKEENRHIVMTMMLMTILFPLSVVPVGFTVVMDEGNYYFPGWELFVFVSWRLFLASSAWNPWVYNMRSAKFQQDMRQTFSKMVPTRFREMLYPYTVCLQRKKENESQKDSVRQRKMLRTLGLSEDHVQ